MSGECWHLRDNKWSIGIVGRCQQRNYCHRKGSTVFIVQIGQRLWNHPTSIWNENRIYLRERCGQTEYTESHWEYRMSDYYSISDEIGVPGPGGFLNVFQANLIWLILTFTYFTQIQCKTYDDETKIEYDLTSLINSKENYLARINDTFNGKDPAKYVVCWDSAFVLCTLKMSDDLFFINVDLCLIAVLFERVPIAGAAISFGLSWQYGHLSCGQHYQRITQWNGTTNARWWFKKYSKTKILPKKKYVHRAWAIRVYRWPW